MTICCSCNVRPVRTLPDPIPEGWPLMLSESIAGRALYCFQCWDDPAEVDPDAD